jgi:hypothetical protein
LPVDAGKVAEVAARMRPESVCSEHRFDPIKNRFRIIRWNDQVHWSVGYRADTARHNNPPVGLCRVDDDGTQVGAFAHA